MEFTPEQISQKLSAYRGWEYLDGKLVKTYRTVDFLKAMDFVNKVAVIAENLNHHPDLSVHDYNQITFSLRTHDAQGVTEKDFALLKEIEQTAALSF